MFSDYNEVQCFSDDCDVPEAKHNYMYNAGLAERGRFFSHLWSPHAENVEVRLVLVNAYRKVRESVTRICFMSQLSKNTV